MLKKHTTRIFKFILASICLFGLYVIFEMKMPDCAQAQSCVTVRPTIRYGSIGASLSGSSGGCDGRFVNVAAPGTGDALVQLTGWSLNYTPLSTDHEVDEMRVQISNIVSSPSSVTFTVNACLNDNNPNDSWAWLARYVVVRWP